MDQCHKELADSEECVTLFTDPNGRPLQANTRSKRSYDDPKPNPELTVSLSPVMKVVKMLHLFKTTIFLFIDLCTISLYHSNHSSLLAPTMYPTTKAQRTSTTNYNHKPATSCRLWPLARLGGSKLTRQQSGTSLKQVILIQI